MIRIKYEDKKQDIEKFFWNWFTKYHKDKFLVVLEKDEILQELIFEDKCRYLEWKANCIDGSTKYDVIKKFFYSSPQKHFEYCEKMQNRSINAESKSFFEDRYCNFRKSQIPKIIDILGIRTCPYCNRSFIDVYYSKASNKPDRFNGDIDHYFSQSEHPYLALCIYNLIPCCKTCNQEKSKQEKRVFHPYMDSHIGMYRFITEFNEDGKNMSSGNFFDYLYGLSENFKLQVFEYFDKEDKVESVDRIKQSVDVFELERKYVHMTCYAKDIIRKAYIYNNGYLDELVEKYEGILNKKEIIKMLFDYQDDNLLDKPLSKLKYDIMTEFEVI